MPLKFLHKIFLSWGAWMAQSVKHLTLDFGSGHDLTVPGFKPCVRLYTDSAEPAWDCLSLSLSAPPVTETGLDHPAEEPIDYRWTIDDR